MSKKIFVANWKMNGNTEMIDKFSGSKILNSSPKKDIIICPPYTHINYLSSKIRDKNISLGAQNCSHKENGALTGEISAEILKDIGCEYVILGHSERRANYSEDNSLINQKIILASKNNIIPILCCGENLEDRKNNLSTKIIENQLSILKEISDNFTCNKFLIAYEPIWAIGTGKSASSPQIYEILNFIHEYTYDIFSQLDLSILYGGSVSTSNIKELLTIDKCNGFLIGGASLSLDSFELICESI